MFFIDCFDEDDLAETEAFEAQAPLPRQHTLSANQIPTLHANSVRTDMSLPADIGPAEYKGNGRYLLNHPPNFPQLYAEWQQTGKLATRRTISHMYFRAAEAETLVDAYACSLSGVGGSNTDGDGGEARRFRNACVDAVVKVLDEYGMVDDLEIHVGQNPIFLCSLDCGMVGVVALYCALSMDRRFPAAKTWPHTQQEFDQVWEREWKRMAEGASSRDVWEEFVRGGRHRFYEEVKGAEVLEEREEKLSSKL